MLAHPYLVSVSVCFCIQNNKLVKIPLGAFENLSNLWELCLQNNLLSNDGMDNETFRYKTHQLF